MYPMNKNSTSDSIRWILRDTQTGQENMEIDWLFEEGSWTKVRLTNSPNSGHPMQHPIHFHGQRFVILSENGTPPASLGWKDTVLVPMGEYVDILVDMSNPGTWMTHCHISEHMASGMMMNFSVE